MRTYRAALVLLSIAISGCRGAAVDRPPIVQPGAPGEATRTTTAAAATDLSQVQHTDADVRFMQGMIAHHTQALEMTTLLRSRTRSDDMRLLAERIDASQTDEMDFMRAWLRARGADPDAAAAHVHHGMLMPGMLTPDEMAQLAAATGPGFDRLFLEGMIKHHVGALTMVEELFATPGAGQESEIFAFASDVDADQRIDIRRMSAMLQELEP